MRPTSRPSGRTRNPIIEAARRAQIIAAAIEVVAEVGYAHASLARIAAQAEVSKSVVSYHFSDKDELLEQVVMRIYGQIGAFIEARVSSEGTASGKIRAYIAAELEYLRDNRTKLLAVGSIVTNHRTDGELRFAADADDAVVTMLSDILRRGQLDGEFGDFDPKVMAITINQALDGALAQYARNANEDLDVYAAELTRLFAAATARDAPAGTSPRQGAEIKATAAVPAAG